MASRSVKERLVSGADLSGQREFSARLVLELAKEPGNLFVSPFSAWSLLALLHPGARGETRAMMNDVLGIGEKEVIDRVVGRMLDLASTSRKSREFRALDLESPPKTLGPKKQQFELIVANGLWVQEGYQLQHDYEREISDRFKARIEEVDFQTSPDAACDTINAWADENTRGRIQEVLSPAEIDTLTRLILANATYFKDKWVHQFEADLTRPEPFRRLDGSDVEVQMMHQTTDLPYLEDRKLQAVKLPYLHSGLSMTVVLPRKVRNFEARLTPKRLDELLGATFGVHTVDLAFPRCRYSGELRLVPTLRELGLGCLFGDSADLSGISSERGAHVDEVKQVTFVKVDEEGTEAAAVTVATFIGAMPDFEQLMLKVMIVDRPYWFFIRDERSGIVLFAGRVEDPS